MSLTTSMTGLQQAASDLAAAAQALDVTISEYSARQAAPDDVAKFVAVSTSMQEKADSLTTQIRALIPHAQAIGDLPTPLVDVVSTLDATETTVISDSA